MLTSSDIFLGLISSTFVSALCVLMRRILCLIFIAPHCKFTVPLVKHCVITKGPVYGFSFFMQCIYRTLVYLQLYSSGQLDFYFCGYYLYYISSTFAYILIFNPSYVLSRESYHGQIPIGTYYYLSAYFLLSKLQMLLQLKCLTMGYLRQSGFV